MNGKWSECKTRKKNLSVGSENLLNSKGKQTFFLTHQQIFVLCCIQKKKFNKKSTFIVLVITGCLQNTFISSPFSYYFFSVDFTLS